MATRSTFLVLLLHIAGRGVEAQAAAGETYTQNAVCRQNYCINPLFPGLNDLPRLEQIVWQCTDHQMVNSYLDFCKGVVNYPTALPSPNSTSQKVSLLVKAQDDAASTMFFYHLSGMGYDAWDHQDPSKDSDQCVRSVWKMVCYTYFPKNQAGCGTGESTPYKRPCMDVCQSYLSSCAVECCDESPQCTFHHTVHVGGGRTKMQTGYVDAVGPSALCTGSGSSRLGAPLSLLLGLLGLHMAASGAGAGGGERRRPSPTVQPTVGAMAPASGLGRWLLCGAVFVCMLSLQGCDMEIPHHRVGNWRRKADYLVSFEFLPPGQPPSSALLNGCSISNSTQMLCSGHGYCKEWNPTSMVADAVSFCVCDRDWVDPECRTRRKSQVKAYLLSLFGGLLGLDYFYLGFPLWGVAKLVTLGGLGTWWLVDVVRTGAGPIYAYNYRVASDLPHWVYVLSCIGFFGILGFLVAIESYLRYRKKKRHDVMKLQESEETHRSFKPDEIEGPRFRINGPRQSFEGRHTFSGYGAAIPMPHPNAGVPMGVHPPPGQYAGPYRLGPQG